MRGYLQRLVMARDMQGRAASADARPALPSRSPIAQADQRLGVGGVADAVAPFAPEGGASDVASQPLAESRTVPSYKLQGAAKPPAPARPVPLAATTLPRYAMPMPAVVAAAPPAAAAAASPPPTPSVAPVAEPREMGRGAPAARSSPLPTPEAVSAERPPARRDESTRPLPSPEARLGSVDATPSVEAPRLPDAVLPAIAPVPVRSLAVETSSRPAAADEPKSPTPQHSRRDHLASIEIPPSSPRPAREIELTDDEPAHAPAAPQDRIVVRETIRTPVEIRETPHPPPQKGPRTAADASVIGPLPRPELTRARIELWLR